MPKPSFIHFDKNRKAGISVPIKHLKEIVSSLYSKCTLQNQWPSDYFVCPCGAGWNDSIIDKMFPSLEIKLGDGAASATITLKASHIMHHDE